MGTTWETLTYLMEHETDAEIFKALGDKTKSFSELKKATGVKYNSTFSRALRRLSKYGLIFHVYTERSNIHQSPSVRAPPYSFYETTPFGKKLLKLYKEIEPIADAELAAQTNISKGRFIKRYLPEHPVVEKKLSAYRSEQLTHCDLCGNELALEDVKIVTPKYGTLCLDCWSEKAGKIIEKHPVSNSKPHSQK